MDGWIGKGRQKHFIDFGSCQHSSRCLKPGLHGRILGGLQRDDWISRGKSRLNVVGRRKHQRRRTDKHVVKCVLRSQCIKKMQLRAEVYCSLDFGRQTMMQQPKKTHFTEENMCYDSPKCVHGRLVRFTNVRRRKWGRKMGLFLSPLSSVNKSNDDDERIDFLTSLASHGLSFFCVQEGVERSLPAIVGREMSTP